jgi:hypothetical protein
LTRDLQARADMMTPPGQTIVLGVYWTPRQSFVILSPLLDLTLCFGLLLVELALEDGCGVVYFWKFHLTALPVRSFGVPTANGGDGFRAVLTDHQSSCTSNTLALPQTRSNWTVIQG